MTKSPIKIVLFSEINSKFGMPFLLELLSNPAEILVEALVTSPEGKLCPYYIQESNSVDLKEEARSRGIKVFQPKDVNSEELIANLDFLQADYFLIANYQKILQEKTIYLPRKATINFHPSPLPRYAGLAPFFWMARNGEIQGGVSAILVNQQIDGGPIIAQIPVSLSGNETALEIRNQHFKESLNLLRVVIKKLLHQDLKVVQQNLSQRTYYGKPREEDYLIDWNTDTETVLRSIRAGYRYPGAFTVNSHEEKIIILSADCKVLLPEITQPHEPGSVYCSSEGVLVSTKDGWIRINSIDIDGEEIKLHSLEQFPALKTKLLASRPKRSKEVKVCLQVPYFCLNF